MNFNNWHQTIINRIMMRYGEDYALMHFGATGVFGSDRMQWLGTPGGRNVVIMQDFEPLHKHVVDFFEVKISTTLRFIMAHSCSNADNLLMLPKLDYWYFFSHAFVALDWFREFRFYDTTDLVASKTFEYAYMCLNHLTFEMRNYRLLLASRIIERRIEDRGILTYQVQPRADDKFISALPESERQRIENITSGVSYDIDSVGDFNNASANINIAMTNKCFLNVVTETCFYQGFNHLTEKVFKPIVMMQPFLLVSTAGSLAYLRQYGFKTFGDWIDESYDSIKNPFRRLDAIAAELEKITALTPEQQRAMYNEMLPVLEHNRNHFYNGLYDIVNKEMWDNFDKIMKKGS